MPIAVNRTPPINSHFHAISRKVSKTNDGIRCIKKEKNCCQMVVPDSNASVANKLTKRIARMQMILGTQ